MADPTGCGPSWPRPAVARGTCLEAETRRQPGALEGRGRPFMHLPARPSIFSVVGVALFLTPLKKQLHRAVSHVLNVPPFEVCSSGVARGDVQPSAQPAGNKVGPSTPSARPRPLAPASLPITRHPPCHVSAIDHTWLLSSLSQGPSGARRSVACVPPTFLLAEWCSAVGLSHVPCVRPSPSTRAACAPLLAAVTTAAGNVRARVPL